MQEWRIGAEKTRSWLSVTVFSTLNRYWFIFHAYNYYGADTIYFFIYFCRFQCVNLSSFTATRCLHHIAGYFFVLTKETYTTVQQKYVSDFTRYIGTHPEKAIGYNQCLSLCRKGLAHTLRNNFSRDMQLILWDSTEICTY